MLRKLVFPLVFPDARVERAYLDPMVDHSSEAFAWQPPDLDGLRRFASSGWVAVI
jgi:hypothetical protein